MNLSAESIGSIMAYVIVAHDQFPRDPRNRYRRWDGQTPYGIHPVACATLMLQEPRLPQRERVAGAEALLLHDLIEDTTAPLPEDTSAEVAQYVHDMTFENTEDEMVRVWEKPPFIRLLKLFDKTSNLLDAGGINPERLTRYIAYTRKLADDVENHWGNLNIVSMARAICDLRDADLMG